MAGTLFDLSQYRSFAFVRNPWDRLVSWYSLLERHDEVCSARFHQFVLELMARPESGDGRVEYLLSQERYLTTDDGKSVDYLGRYENLQADLARIFGLLGVKVGNLERVNTSTHQHYREYYSDQTLALLAPHFEDDCKKFGYKF